MAATRAAEPPTRIPGSRSTRAERRTVRNMGTKKTSPRPKSKSMKTRRTPMGTTRSPRASTCPRRSPFSRTR